MAQSDIEMFLAATYWECMADAGFAGTWGVIAMRMARDDMTIGEVVEDMESGRFDDIPSMDDHARTVLQELLCQ